MTRLEADLARIEPGRTVIVALHISVLGSRHERNGQRRPGVGTADALEPPSSWPS